MMMMKLLLPRADEIHQLTSPSADQHMLTQYKLEWI